MRTQTQILIASSFALMVLDLCPLRLPAGEAMREVQVIRDVVAAGVVDRAVVIPKDQFTLNSVSAYGRGFWESRRQENRVMRLTVGTDPLEVAASLYKHVPGKTLEDAYAAVAARVARDELATSSLARVFATRDGALLSYHDGNGVREVPLEGSRDPTRVRIGETEFHLLHFSTEGREDAPSSYVVRFYSAAKPRLRLRDCEQLLGYLRKLTLLERTELEVAPDPWFVGDPQYPAIHPFQEGRVLPSLLQLKVAPWLSCSLADNRVRCSGHGFEP